MNEYLQSKFGTDDTKLKANCIPSKYVRDFNHANSLGPPLVLKVPNILMKINDMIQIGLLILAELKQSVLAVVYSTIIMIIKLVKCHKFYMNYRQKEPI